MVLNTDVIIIGKGIAGLALSFLLSKKRIRHVLVSRREKQKPMALGETLPPSALPMLRSLDLLGIFEQNFIHKTTGYHSLWGGKRVIDHNFYFNRPFQYGLKLNKQNLIEGLSNLQKRNVREFSRTLDVYTDDDGVSVYLDGNEKISATLIIDATGRKRAVSKTLAIREESFDELMAFSCHIPKVRLSNLPHGVFVESFAHGWGIVSELSETTNVMSLYTHKGNPALSSFSCYDQWPDLLKGTNFLRSFADKNLHAKITGGRANTSKLQTFAGRNWLAVGDAAMAFDPLSSHGITSGIYTSNQAAEAIEAHLDGNHPGALEEYSDRLEGIFEEYMRQKGRLYMQENRWPNYDFWREMQQGVETEKTNYFV